MKRFVNLVPEAYRRQVAVRRLLRSWIWTGLLAAGSLVVYVSFQRTLLVADQNRLKVAESRARPYLEMTQATQRLDSEIKAIEVNDALLSRLTAERSPLTPVAVVSKGASECRDRIWVNRLLFEVKLDGAEDAAAKVAGPAKGKSKQKVVARTVEKLTLDGFGADNLSVAEFVAALRGTNAFEHVELKSSVNAALGDVKAWAFTLDGDL